MNDKNIIAAWKADLDKINHVFDVCLIGSVRLSLTTSLQTELALTRSTRTMVSDIHQNMLGVCENIDGENQAVSEARSPTSGRQDVSFVRGVSPHDLASSS